MKSYQKVLGFVVAGLLVGSSNVIAQSMTQSSSKSVTEKVTVGTDSKGNKTYTLPNGSVVSEDTYVDWKKTHVTELVNINNKFKALSPEKAKQLRAAWDAAKAKDKNCLTFQWGGHTYSCKDGSVTQVNEKDILTSQERKVVVTTPPTTVKVTTTTTTIPKATLPPKKPAGDVVQLVGQYSYKEGGRSGKCIGPKGPQKCGTNTMDVNSAGTLKSEIRAGGVIRIGNRFGANWSYTLSQDEADRLSKGKSINIKVKSGGSEVEIKNLHDQQGQDKH